MAGQTIGNWLTVWADGDSPGAGSQTGDSTGVNGNFWKIMEKMAAIFNLPLSTLKKNIIHKEQLHSDVADGSTIGINATSGALEVKDGLPTAKIGDGAVTLAKADATLMDVQAYLIYGTPSTAAATDHASVSVPPVEWTETNTTTIKGMCYFKKRRGDKYVKLLLRVKTSSAGAPWKVELYVQATNGSFGVNTNTTGTNTTYSGGGGSPEASLSLDISSCADDTHCVAYFAVGQVTGAAGTTLAKEPVVMVTTR